MSAPDMRKWNRAHRGAYLKGLHAGLAGEKITACPYADTRKPSGKLSWARSFIRAWQNGWAHAREHRKDALITAAYTSSYRKKK